MQGEVAHTDLTLSVLRGFFCVTYAQADKLVSTVLVVCVFGHASHFFFGACGGSSMRFTGRHTVNSVDGRH